VVIYVLDIEQEETILLSILIRNREERNEFITSSKFGLKSSVIRLYDKIHRLESLCERESLVSGESIKDTLNDAMIYAAMTLIEMKLKEENKASSDEF